MTYNKNGIPINKRERLFNEVYEYTFPYGTFRKYKLDLRLKRIVATVKCFRQDILYVSDSPSIVEAKIASICGENINYSCSVMIQKGA